MNKTRFAVKCFAGAVVTAVLVLGSLAAPAQAKKDTGWGVSDTGWGASDTGWGATRGKDTGWG